MADRQSRGEDVPKAASFAMQVCQSILAIQVFLPLLPEIGFFVQNKTWFVYIILSTKQIVTGILGIDLLNTCPVLELDTS